MLRVSYSAINNIYQRNSGAECRPGQARFMAFSEWMSLLERSGLLGTGISAREAKQAYLFAIMTQVDDIGSER